MRILDKKYAKKIEEKTYCKDRVKVVLIDELYSLIERKSKIIYVMTLVSRDKRQIIGYDIAFDRRSYDGR